ncbi:DsbA family oxidoreductase [Demequina aurantiaca]|uniref:DsbA family oxidoreductase n=1 Tax=Demequina aurantiaca TaxID=676200 RepID=UPI000784EC41|nr:DsbA family oxidoreductase [Demequina aurantiaca]
MVKVEVWSDVACPWCYIGKKRLQDAIAEFDDTVEVQWRSYQLDPTHPKGEVMTQPEMFAKRGIAADQVAQMNERVTGIAAEVGLDYDLDSYMVSNTKDAHRLSHFADARGVGDQMHERLFQAQMMEGKILDDADVLVGLGEDVGIPADDTRAMLASDEFAAAVDADIADAQMVGVQGVPFFVFDRKYAVSGAQPKEMFTRALETARSGEVPAGQ